MHARWLRLQYMSGCSTVACTRSISSAPIGRVAWTLAGLRPARSRGRWDACTGARTHTGTMRCGSKGWSWRRGSRCMPRDRSIDPARGPGALPTLPAASLPPPPAAGGCQAGRTWTHGPRANNATVSRQASIDARGRGAADAATSGHVIQRSAAIGLRCGDANAVPCHGTMIYLSIRTFVIYDVDPAARQSRYRPNKGSILHAGYQYRYASFLKKLFKN